MSSSRPNRKLKKGYALLAWGTSIVATSIVGLMELKAPYWWLKPNFGLSTCWFHGKWALLLYFYGPIGK